MNIIPATMGDLREMDALRRTEQEAVSFIPMSKWEEQVGRDDRCLVVGRENGDLVAYCYWTAGLPVAAIQQVVVRSDARRDERGSAMVEAALRFMESDPRRYGVTCRCRVDLEATAFWEALGFEPVRIEETGGRRGPSLRYYRALRPALLDLAPYLPLRPSTGGIRKGFRWRAAKVPA